MPASAVSTADFDPVRDASAIRTVLERWSPSGENASVYWRLLDVFDTLPMAGRLVSVDSRPSGFSIWEETDREAGFANAFAHLAVHEVKGLSHFVMVDMCRALRARGFNQVCVGGSESEGLDRFKRKFAPMRSVALCSLRTASPALVARANFDRAFA